MTRSHGSGNGRLPGHLFRTEATADVLTDDSNAAVVEVESIGDTFANVVDALGRRPDRQPVSVLIRDCAVGFERVVDLGWGVERSPNNVGRGFEGLGDVTAFVLLGRPRQVVVSIVVDQRSVVGECLFGTDDMGLLFPFDADVLGGCASGGAIGRNDESNLITDVTRNRGEERSILGIPTGKSDVVGSVGTWPVTVAGSENCEHASKGQRFIDFE